VRFDYEKIEEVLIINICVTYVQCTHIYTLFLTLLVIIFQQIRQVFRDC